MGRRTAAPLALLVASAAALLPSPARGEGPPPDLTVHPGDVLEEPSVPRPLRIEPWRDGLVLGLAGGVALGLGAASSRLTPATCRWCGVDALDEEAREAVLSSNPARAARASDVLANLVLPVGAVAALEGSAWAAGAPVEGLRDLVPVTEAVLIATDLELVTKDLAGRIRPGAWAAGSAGHGDQLHSFFSGHTTLAFSLATSAGEVATLRGYPAAPWIWGVGLGLAAGVGWLRMAADAHWLTDVLAGAAIGTAAGVGVPWVLHRPLRGPPVEVRAAPGGLALRW